MGAGDPGRCPGLTHGVLTARGMARWGSVFWRGVVERLQGLMVFGG